MNVLFVCAQGAIRSRTAEVLSTLGGMSARSCGIDDDAIVPVNNRLLAWADHIVCMEKLHSDYVKLFCECDPASVISLGIPDEYMPFDDELIALLIGSLHYKLEQVSDAIVAGRDEHKRRMQCHEASERLQSAA